jgi:transcriptional regulator with XRE-family HTH domain
MDVKVLVGRNVRRFRLEKGLTQEKLTEDSGVSQQYISELERGARNPTIDTLAKIALALGVTTTDLFEPVPDASR